MDSGFPPRNNGVSDGVEVTEPELEQVATPPVDNDNDNKKDADDPLRQVNFVLDPDENDGHDLHLARFYKDHFTLAVPSSTVRFRSKQNCARVFENKSSQFVLEETYDPETKKREITAKQMNDATTGLQVLRGIYTLVCSLFFAFFFVFCLQAILFLVLDLAIESGATVSQPNDEKDNVFS
jgi:hypothetical protein